MSRAGAVRIWHSDRGGLGEGGGTRRVANAKRFEHARAGAWASNYEASLLADRFGVFGSGCVGPITKPQIQTRRPTIWSVGLDVHQRSSTICILDENGKRVKQQQVRGSWQKVVEVLQHLAHPFAICYEASCGYGALHDRLCRVAKRVMVAYIDDPRRFTRTRKMGSYFGLVRVMQAMLRAGEGWRHDDRVAKAA